MFKCAYCNLKLNTVGKKTVCPKCGRRKFVEIAENTVEENKAELVNNGKEQEISNYESEKKNNSLEQAEKQVGNQISDKVAKNITDTNQKNLENANKSIVTENSDIQKHMFKSPLFKPSIVNEDESNNGLGNKSDANSKTPLSNGQQFSQSRSNLNNSNVSTNISRDISNLNTQTNTQNRRYNIDGVFFNIGKEAEALLFIYEKKKIYFVFERNSNKFKNVFLNIVKGYYLHNQSDIDNFEREINKIRNDSKNITLEKLFYFVMIYLLEALIIKDNKNASIILRNRDECVKDLPEIIVSSNSLINEYFDLFKFFLKVDSFNTKSYKDMSGGEIAYIEEIEGRVNFKYFGKESDFIDSLQCTDAIYEKKYCIRHLYQFEDFINQRSVDNDILDFLNIDASLFNDYLYNLKYYCSHRTVITFPGRYILSSTEMDFFNIFRKAVDDQRDVKYKKFVKTVLYLLKINFFNNSLFSMINSYKINNKYVTELAKGTYDSFLDEYASTLDIKYVLVDDKYYTIYDLSEKISKMNDYEAIVTAKRLMKDQIDKILTYNKINLKDIKNQLKTMKG